MDLVLFIVFLALSLILIIVGLFKAEHTELSIIGFVFLFLLSMPIIQEELTYVVGYDTNITYTYNYSNNNTLLSSTETVANRYGSITASSTISHRIGYWLAVASIIGFIGVLLGIRKPKEF